MNITHTFNNMIKIDFIYCSAVNFAMQQNHVPVIRKILLKNETEQTIDDVKIAVSLSPDLTITVDRVIDSVPAGTMIEVKDLQINISAKYLSELTEKVCGEIIIAVSKGDERIITEKYPIEILPFDQWAGVAILPEMLAAFVTPNHPLSQQLFIEHHNFWRSGLVARLSMNTKVVIRTE